MNTHRRGRVPALVALACLLVAAPAGCGVSVPADQVGSTVVTQLTEQGVQIDGGRVTCPDDLDAEVGRTMRCGFTAGGQPVDAVATVSSVDGGSVNLQIATEARPVPRAVLEKAVTDQAAGDGVPVDRVTCDGELQPQVGRLQTCTLAAGGRQTRLTTTVTGIRGGLVNFSVRPS